MRVIIHQSNSFLSNDKTLEFFLHSLLFALYKHNNHNSFIQLTYDSSLPQPAFKHVAYFAFHTPLYARLWKKQWQQAKAKKIIQQQPIDAILSISAGLQIDVPEFVFITGTRQEDIIAAKPACTVISPSKYIARQLEQQGIASSKIKILRPWCSALFRPVEWDIREQAKEKFSEGNEYILLKATHLKNDEIINVLKSFSLFKKWQKTSMQILITHLQPYHDEVKKMLLNYKYRADVKLITAETYHSNEQLIMASAWVLLHFPSIDYSGVGVMEAMQSETPVITQQTGAIEETIGEGAVYCTLNNVDALSEAFINLYKNEKQKNEIVRIAKNRLALPEAEGIDQLYRILSAGKQAEPVAH